jgi:hypothetical protein
VVLDFSNKENACASAHPLHKDVVQDASAPIHTHAHSFLFQPTGKLHARELSTLIGIENRWLPLL